MRRFGGIAAAAGLCVLAVSGMAAGGRTAKASPKPPVSVSLTLSRAHGVLTVVVKNDSSSPICIDPNYAASARIMAFGRDGKPLRNPMAQEGGARVECVPIAPHRALHMVYEINRLYPFGVPGEARVCYGAWWRFGTPGVRYPIQKLGRCVAAPKEGIGRR